MVHSIASNSTPEQESDACARGPERIKANGGKKDGEYLSSWPIIAGDAFVSKVYPLLCTLVRSLIRNTCLRTSVYVFYKLAVYG